jgi:hypothetical protein
MSSQLNVDTIVDKAGSGGTNVKVANTSTYVSDGGAVTQNTVQGLAKNWCSYSFSASIQDSFNVSGITDEATASHTLTFTNSMSNDDYSASCGALGTSQETFGVIRTIATSSYRCNTYNSSVVLMKEIQLV